MPTLGSRHLFPDLTLDAYLNHSAISPMSRPVQERIHAITKDYAAKGLEAFFTWQPELARLKTLLADLIHAPSSGDLALVPNTSFGVMATALCFPWEPGDRVVVFRGEFPTNVTPWQRAASMFGLEVIFHDIEDYKTNPDIGLTRLEDTLKKGKIRLVAVSAVQFQTGLLMPLETMANLCHAAGAELFVDAIQAVGIVPLDVQQIGLDYLACGSHKWLMGPEGAGFLYARPERAAALRPHFAGWLSHDEPLSFLFEGSGHLRYDRPIRQSIDFLECGASNVIGFSALAASVDLTTALGVEAIFDHVTTYLDTLEPLLVERGLVSQRTPRREGQSGIASFTLPAHVGLARLNEGLLKRGIACSTPDGYLRFAPHWPNNLDEIPQVVQALDDALIDANI